MEWDWNKDGYLGKMKWVKMFNELVRLYDIMVDDELNAKLTNQYMNKFGSTIKQHAKNNYIRMFNPYTPKVKNKLMELLGEGNKKYDIYNMGYGISSKEYLEMGLEGLLNRFKEVDVTAEIIDNANSDEDKSRFQFLIDCVWDYNR